MKNYFCFNLPQGFLFLLFIFISYYDKKSIEKIIFQVLFQNFIFAHFKIL